MVGGKESTNTPKLSIERPVAGGGFLVFGG